MKKSIFVLLAMTLATNANAGLLDSLGLVKKPEPTTLQEACDKNEITKVCPGVLLGTKTIVECLSDNISALSTQCANFVKKSVSQKADELKAKAANVTSGVATAKSDIKPVEKEEIKAKAKAAAQEKTSQVTNGLLNKLF